MQLRSRALLIGLLVGTGFLGSAAAQTETPTTDELARRIELLAAELDDLEHADVRRPLQPQHGFGPAASKVYAVDQGFSLGGYGEMVYSNFASGREDNAPSELHDRIDFLRQILYVGYKFDDHLVFNAEIEFEHASTEESGEVSVEFAHVDFMIRPAINARAGLLLVPMGFVNELHEPPIFLGVHRPEVERLLIPTTWRANGIGIFGAPEGSLGGVQYRAYVVESLVSGVNGDGPRFTQSGLRSGRQSGSEALAEDFAGVVRADYERDGISAGGSIFFGQTSQGARVDVGTGLERYGAFTTIYEGHAQLHKHGVQLRGLLAGANVRDAGQINTANNYTGSESVGSSLLGWYLELGWDVLRQLHPGSRFALTPYARYTEVNTQHEVPIGFTTNPANDQQITTFGAAFHPHAQVVVKADYTLRRNGARTGVDQWNMGLGYLF